MNELRAVLTGDIIGSRKVDASIWTPLLQAALSRYAQRYEMFRGDSFQASIPLANVLEAALYIKSSMIAVKGLDMRMGIGIGSMEDSSTPLSSSTGTALIHSGYAFDNLKKESLLIKSDHRGKDELINIILALVTAICQRWTPNMAKTVCVALEHPEANQEQLAQLLHRNYQSQVSTELNKAEYYKLKQAIAYCTLVLLK